MEYQKIMNSLNNATNQLTQFRTKIWIEINDDARGTYNKVNQIKFKTSMLKSRLCHYSDAYILVKGTILIARVLAPLEPKNVGKKAVLKNCAPLTYCISEIKIHK